MKENLKTIAQSFAEEYCSDAVYPAHLFKAVLHKDVGLVKFIESDLDKDYYYLQDWADVQMQLAPRAVRPMRDLELSDESQNVMDEAEEYKIKFGLDEANAICVLAALVTPGVGFSFDQLKTLPMTAAEISEKMGAGAEASTPCYEPTPGVAPKGSSSGAEQYCIDKVKQAREGKLGVIVGFEKELETVFETLGRKTKSSLLITGEAGVGKTALIEAFATRLANNEVPDFLKDAAAMEVDLAAISADAQYKGEVENRFKNILKMMSERRGSGSAVLIIESLDKLFDKQGSLFGCSAMLKQELTRGQLQLLCTSSIDGFTKNIETDKEMTSKLEKLTVEEPTADLCLDILKGALPAYEEFHGIKIGEQVMEDAIRLAKRYLSEKALPDSAFDLIDRSMAALKIQNNKVEDESQRRTDLATADMEAVVAKQTGIPLGKVQTSERDRLLGAEDTLKERVIGQDHAIKKVLDSVFESRSGLNKKGQPMGSFFFLGPTGTGKTELSKALAAFLFGDESALVRFDMSEFKEEHSVALLYGAPPGYVGYEEGGLLVNKIRQNPYSVVLFDEIEKAHKSVFDLFLQILDEGKLHDRLGRVGDFSNALILFTSNIGSQYIAKKFQEGNIPTNTEMMDIMQQYFRPEFLARLTEIVPFSPITEQTVVKIFDIHLKGLLKLLNEQDIKLEMSDEVKAKVAMRGFDPQYGARQIIGNIRKDLRHPLSKLIIAGKVKGGDTVVVGVDGDELKFDIK
ncbi:MAG: ATP-dependent Clp protease ATP-binding subunit [Prevotellaceae bacterium]|nr:ATP-dependent Clp protease ATP-binding subunit [Prevotellaceae bacterium]MDD6781068.1 ATP-dependent Clp protease ATP-binding subunit [Prevotellaceae bacterium]